MFTMQLLNKYNKLNNCASHFSQRLPAYLTVNFFRFQYKAKEGINAKILKDIKFPIDFDAFELCSKSLQEELTSMRFKFKVSAGLWLQ